MSGAQTRAASRSLMVLLLAGASLAACATPQPRYASRLSGGDQMGGPASRPSAPQSGPRYKIGDPYQVAGIWYVPKEQPNYDETGIASWYGDAFNMQPTANGEIFDMNQISGAHTTLPLPSIVEVTNLDNGRKLKVRVNDRGPFVGGRVIDLSRAAAHELGYDQAGLAHVRVRYVGPAPLDAANPPVRYASNSAPAASRGWSTPAYPISTAAAPVPSAPTQAGGYERAPSYAAAPVTATSLPPAPVAVSSSALPPVTGSAIAPGGAIHGPVYATTYAPSVPQTQLAGSTLYRVQAGAFGDRDNARRVVASLSSAGSAEIEPFERDGAMLYRVVLPGGADEGAAFALRDRVASLGYADARVLRPHEDCAASSRLAGQTARTGPVAPVARGRFITFEGGEGVGKSTQIRRLAARLQAQGREIVATREPGGSAGAEAIRDLVLRGSADRWSPVTETLLMYAARRDHIERVIRPALDRGAWVVCDRYADSTRAYQGAAGGVDPALISAMEAHVLDGAHPDLTLIFDLDPELGLARAADRAGAEMRFESKGGAFHARLRQAFLEIARAEPDRCRVIDAAGTQDEVEASVWAVVAAHA